MHQWQSSGRIGVLKPELPTVTVAVKQFIEEAAVRNLAATTLKKRKDSFFFLKRLRVSAEDTDSGLDAVNFGPAPGVSYVWTVSVRQSPFWRVARPSLGINVSFTDWDDPAFS